MYELSIYKYDEWGCGSAYPRWMSTNSLEKIIDEISRLIDQGNVSWFLIEKDGKHFLTIR